MKRTVLLIFACMASLQMTNAQDLKTIDIEGNSEMMIVPDEALIQVTVQKKAMTVAEATRDLNAATKNITDAFDQSDLQSHELTANNYYVNVNRVYQKGTSKDSGYVASQNLKIKVNDIEKELAQAVELLNQAGDHSINVSFNISSTMEKSYQKQLLESALADALEKSEHIASVLDLKNVSVHQVRYLSDQSNVRPYQLKTAAMMYDAAESRQAPTFMPEEQKISDKVLVTFTFTP